MRRKRWGKFSQVSGNCTEGHSRADKAAESSWGLEPLVAAQTSPQNFDAVAGAPRSRDS